MSALRSGALRLGLALAFAVALAQGASAQLFPEPVKRPFDRVSGMLIVCRAVPAYAWTDAACTRMIVEARRRAALNKLPIASVDSLPDFPRHRFGSIEGIDGDKAVRVSFVFKAPKGHAWRLSLSLESYFIFVPSGPNVAPGQRLPMNFYAQGVDFLPGVSESAARPAINQLLKFLLSYGDGKL